jgi:hypothetical protein
MKNYMYIHIRYVRMKTSRFRKQSPKYTDRHTKKDKVIAVYPKPFRSGGNI